MRVNCDCERERCVRGKRGAAMRSGRGFAVALAGAAATVLGFGLVSVSWEGSRFGWIGVRCGVGVLGWSKSGSVVVLGVPCVPFILPAEAPLYSGEAPQMMVSL